MKIPEDKPVENCVSVVKHDKFCWRCCGEGTSLKCSSCVRSFHSNCASKDETNNVEADKWLCYVCTKLKGAENADKKSDLEVLPILIDKALKDKSFSTLKRPLKGATEESIVNLIDLTKIKENIGTYNSFEHFLADVQWIVHNCFILFVDNHEQMETAKSLVDYLEGEIEMLKKCAECYSNAEKHPNTWFTMTCNEPHLIVWAKKVGFTYWPAKMISIDGQLINVRFFGDHDYAEVPATNCFLYSDTNPNRSRNTTVAYKSALKEAEEYIKNVRQKFGAYNLFETKTAFNPSSLGKYIVQVIPKLAGSQMVKSIKAKCKIPDQGGRKPNSAPSPKPNSTPKPKPRIEESEPIQRTVTMTPISPRKNVVIALARIDQNDDDKMLNPKRNSSWFNDKDLPREKKIKLSHEDTTENGIPSEIQNSTPVVVIPNESFNNAMNNNDAKDTNKNETNDTNKSDCNENAVVSSADGKETNDHDEPVKKMLNSTEMECSVEDSTLLNQSTISDLSFIGGYSVEEPTSTACCDGDDWDPSVSKEIAEAARLTVISLMENKLKSKFENVKNKLYAVTLERDQAERLKLKTKDEHVKQMADLNEKYVQLVAKAKKDAENDLKAELEKRIKAENDLKAESEKRIKAENDLKDANRMMNEKLADAEINLANAKIVYEAEKDEQNRTMAQLQQQKNEMEAEKQEAISKMAKEHGEKVAELEGKLQEKSDKESQLEARYRDIVAGIRQKAEVERRERQSCACCGKALETKRICSTQCEQMWGVWKSPDSSDKTLE